MRLQQTGEGGHVHLVHLQAAFHGQRLEHKAAAPIQGAAVGAFDVHLVKVVFFTHAPGGQVLDAERHRQSQGTGLAAGHVVQRHAAFGQAQMADGERGRTGGFVFRRGLVGGVLFAAFAQAGDDVVQVEGAVLAPAQADLQAGQVHIADPGAPVEQRRPEGGIHVQAVKPGQEVGVRIRDPEPFRGGRQRQRVEPHFFHGHVPPQQTGQPLLDLPTRPAGQNQKHRQRVQHIQQGQNRQNPGAPSPRAPPLYRCVHVVVPSARLRKRKV